MKYIVDIDALKNCLTFIETFKVDGHDVAYLNNIKLFIDYFPKEPVEEQATDVGDT